jgi:hypothetical protein
VKINKNLTDILRDNVKYKQAKEKLLEHLKGGNKLGKSVNQIVVEESSETGRSTSSQGSRRSAAIGSEEKGQDARGESLVLLDRLFQGAIDDFVAQLDGGAFDAFIDSPAFDNMVTQVRYGLRQTRQLSRRHPELYPQSAEVCTLLLEYAGQFLHVDAYQKKYLLKIGIVQLLNENTVQAVLSFAHKWYRSEMQRYARRGARSVRGEAETGSETETEASDQLGVLDVVISAIPAEVHDVLGRILATSVRGGVGSKGSRPEPVTLSEFTAVMSQLFDAGAAGVEDMWATAGAGVDESAIRYLLSLGEALRSGVETDFDAPAGVGAGVGPVERLRRSIVSHPLVQDFINSPHNQSALVAQFIPADMLGVMAQQVGRQLHQREQELTVEELLADLAGLLDSSERFEALFDVFDTKNSDALVESYKSFVKGLQQSSSGSRERKPGGGDGAARKARRRRRPGVITPEDAAQNGSPKNGESLFQAL